MTERHMAFTMKVFIVIRTRPSLAIMGVFSTRPKANGYMAKNGGEGRMFVEEWTVA
jgi:hypothetical protein